MGTRKTRKSPVEMGRGRDEAAFLAGYDATRWPRPSVAVDVVVLTIRDRALRALLVERADHPFRGRWALPGGFVGMEESIDAAAKRALAGKAGLEGVFLEQLYTFGEPRRDPRTRVVSVAHVALVPAVRLAAWFEGEGEARASRFIEVRVPWEGEAGGPAEVVDGRRRLALAFDHAEILGVAVKRIRGKLDYTPIGFELLPETFTLRELQDVHETILGRALNKDSFRRRMLASDQLEGTGEIEEAVGHRPAERFRFVGR
jgi:8-oxo-dGTP diphosphatase